MKLLIISIGDKLPKWAIEGIYDYEKRFHSFSDFTLETTLIPAQKRGKGSVSDRLIEKESLALINAVPDGYYKIALDVSGKTLSSEHLASKIEKLHYDGRHTAILIGGPEGFDHTVRDNCDERLSLSALTLPHPLAKLVVTETLYRCVSIIKNHPYHRSGER